MRAVSSTDPGEMDESVVIVRLLMRVAMQRERGQGPGFHSSSISGHCVCQRNSARDNFIGHVLATQVQEMLQQSGATMSSLKQSERSIEPLSHNRQQQVAIVQAHPLPLLVHLSHILHKASRSYSNTSLTHYTLNSSPHQRVTSRHPRLCSRLYM